MDDLEKKTRVDAWFFEYRFVRDEIVASTAQFYSILQFGSTMTLGFVGVGVSFWGREDLLVAVILGGLVPTLGFVFVEMLLGQIARMRRGGNYCRELEERLSALIGKTAREMQADMAGTPDLAAGEVKPVGWESWLEERKEGSRRYGWVYTFAIVFFGVVSAASLAGYGIYSGRLWARVVTCSGSGGDATEKTSSTAQGCEKEARDTGSVVGRRGYVAQVCGELRVGSCVYRIGAILLLVTPFVIEMIKTPIWIRQARRIVAPFSLPGEEPARGVCRRMRLMTVAFWKIAFGTLDVSAAATTMGLALVILRAGGWRAFAMLSMAAVGATAATALRRQMRGSKGARERRSWRNALANMGIGALVLALAKARGGVDEAAYGAFSGSLAAVFSDTISHEFGVMVGGTPRLITTGERVAIGANGGVTTRGSMWGIAGAVAVAISGSMLGLTDMKWAMLAAVAGCIGNATDSLLGATLERRGVVSGDCVNLICSITGAVGVVFGAWLIGLPPW